MAIVKLGCIGGEIIINASYLGPFLYELVILHRSPIFLEYFMRKQIVSFAQLDLDSNINKAISACGYTEPTPIQAQAIPDILEGKDVVASAQTGTGKTAAFVLPALQRLTLEKPSKKTRILILTPTRELATQIMKAAHLYGKFLRFNIISLVGGMPYHHQIKDLARGADIIVATPGRLLDHMEQKRVDLSHVEMLVLDEADRMLDMGFIDDVEHIAKLTPAHRQTLLFSATVDKKLTTVVKHLLKHPVRIDLSSEKISAPKIKQELYRVTNPQQKMRLLKHFLAGEHIYKAIIFCATKISADKLSHQLSDLGFPAAALHGDLRQNVRNRTVEQLRRGKIQFLVATDVAARGIDIDDVTHVFNYDLPRFCEDYVHRIGRTGRAGKNGIAISFVMPTDTRHLRNIERYIGQHLQVMSAIDTENLQTEPRKILSLKKDDDERHERPERRREFRGEYKSDHRSDHRSERKSDHKRGERDHWRHKDKDDTRKHNERGYAARKSNDEASPRRKSDDNKSHAHSSRKARGEYIAKKSDGSAPKKKKSWQGHEKRSVRGEGSRSTQHRDK